MTFYSLTKSLSLSVITYREESERCRISDEVDSSKGAWREPTVYKQGLSVDHECKQTYTGWKTSSTSKVCTIQTPCSSFILHLNWVLTGTCVYGIGNMLKNSHLVVAALAVAIKTKLLFTF